MRWKNNWHSFSVSLIKTLPVIVSTPCQSSMMPRKRACEDEDDTLKKTLTGLPQRDLLTPNLVRSIAARVWLLTRPSTASLKCDDDLNSQPRNIRSQTRSEPRRPFAVGTEARQATLRTSRQQRLYLRPLLSAVENLSLSARSLGSSARGMTVHARIYLLRKRPKPLELMILNRCRSCMMKTASQ
jgi:hypothetical protein